LKQSRHWSLILMLQQPLRLPANFSSRFPGGDFRKFRVAALCRSINFLSACNLKTLNCLGHLPANKSSVSFERKDLIIRREYNVKRYTSIELQDGGLTCTADEVNSQTYRLDL
jgi:hypothetical protein